MLVVQIIANREEMIEKLQELMDENAELHKRNKLLELLIIRDMKKVERSGTTES